MGGEQSSTFVPLTRTALFQDRSHSDRSQTTRQLTPASLVEHGRVHELDAKVFFLKCRTRKFFFRLEKFFFEVGSASCRLQQNVFDQKKAKRARRWTLQANNFVAQLRVA